MESKNASVMTDSVNKIKQKKTQNFLSHFFLMKQMDMYLSIVHCS